MASEPNNTDDVAQARHEAKFHGWRLIGIILIVITFIAVASFIVDWTVIGPLEGRVF